MALEDKYINPFTDFVEAAEIARFTPDEKNKYEESLTYYRDLKNVVDTSFDEGKAEGKAEIAFQMKQKGIETNLIAEITGLSIEEIQKL
jgi:predicted transposase/invertase (TIGR01784 family)